MSKSFWKDIEVFYLNRGKFFWNMLLNGDVIREDKYIIRYSIFLMNLFFVIWNYIGGVNIFNDMYLKFKGKKDWFKFKI